MAATRASNDRPPGAGGVKRGRQQQEAAATGSRVTVVLGAQWGDEGKGKVVDLLATDADIISRCQVRGPPPPGAPPRARLHGGGGAEPFLPGTPSQRHPHPLTRAPLPARDTPAPGTPPSPPSPTPTPPRRGPGQSYKYKSC